MQLPLEFRLDPMPPCAFILCAAQRSNSRMECTPRLNDHPIDYEHWPLFGGPFVESEVDSQRFILKHGSLQRILDFKNLTVADTRN